MGAVVAVIGRQTAGYTGFRFDSPVLTEPPGTSGRDAGTPEGTLKTVILGFGVHAEGEGNVAYVKMRVNEIDPGEPAVVNFREVIAHLGDHCEIPPVDIIVGNVIVPEQPAGPGLDACGCTDGYMLSDRNLHREVRLGRRRPEQVGFDGDTGPGLQRIARSRKFLRAGRGGSLQEQCGAQGKQIGWCFF